MRIALVSDVHGNVRGLDACLADLRAQGGADVLVGAGDFCLDGPRPREVLERLEEEGAHCVRGNTDRYIADWIEENDEDAGSVAWQREQLGKRWIEWLRTLPVALSFGEGPSGLRVVHASPTSDEEHIWPDADDAFLERITAGIEERTLAFGHLHLPYARMWRDRLFVDVASAGLPKDGDPRASYAILTQRAGGWQVKHRRVEFDIGKVAREIEKSGMPQAKQHIAVLRRHRYKKLGERIP